LLSEAIVLATSGQILPSLAPEVKKLSLWLVWIQGKNRLQLRIVLFGGNVYILYVAELISD
jgi:hypothetical protein